MKPEQFKKLLKEFAPKLPVNEAGTQLMTDPSVKSKVETVIKYLKDIDVDGETMEYILKSVGMEQQMLSQLTKGREGSTS